MEEVVWPLPKFGTTLRFLRINAVDVSSTDLRNGLSGENWEYWANLLPDPVKSYIVKKRKYQGFPEKKEGNF